MAVSMGRGTLLGVGFIRVEADTAPAEKSLGLLGKAAVVGAAGLATLAVASGVMASHFNNDMLKIQTQAGGTAKDVKVLSGAVLTMKNAQQGPDQLAESLYHLKSIGLDNADAMKDLRSASDLAAVGSSNLEATTNALGGAWRSGIKGAETFAKSAATVNAIIGAGNMRMEDFVSAIGTGILPAAKTFGVSLSSIGSALALMTDEGIPATDAATRLKMSLSLLAAPSNVASKQLAKINLTGLQLANTMRSPAGLVGAIGLLKQHLDASGLSLSQQAILLSHAFGGGRSSSAILTMINNYDVLVKKQDQINNSLGKFPAAVAAQRATVSAQFKILQTTVEQVGIRLGEYLIPPMTKFVSFINSTAIPAVSSFAGALSKMIPEAQIKKSLGTVQSDFDDFVHGITTKVAPAATVKAVAVAARAKPLLTGTNGQALHESIFSAAVPRFAPGAVRNGVRPTVSQVAGTRFQLPGDGTRPGISAAANTSSLFTAAHPMPTAKLPVPDISPWQKAGKEIGQIVKDVGTLTGQLADSLRNVVTAATPTAVFLAVTLLGALTVVAHILSTVLGPAFVSFTNFLATHQGVVKFFTEVILGGLIAKMIILGTLRTATAVTSLGTAVLKFPTSSVSSIGTAFTNLKKAGTDFGTAASGIGTKIKGLGSAIAGIGRSVGTMSANAWKSAVAGAKTFGTAAKNAGQDAAQMSVYAGRAIKSMAKNAWSGAVSGAQAAGGAMKTAGKNALELATNTGRAIALSAGKAWTNGIQMMKDMGAATKVAAVATLDFSKKQAVALGTTVAEAAAVLWDKTAKLADAAATKIVAAVTWLWDAAMAADPLVLVIAGLVALVAAIVYVATKTTWFQTAWHATWNFILGLWNTVYGFLTHGFGQFAILILGPLAPIAFLALHWKETWKIISDSAVAAYDFLDKWVIHPLAASFTWLWTKGIEPAIRFIVLGFTTMVGQILKGAVTMLGWVPGIGGKLKTAEKAFDAFAASVNKSLGGIKPKTVPVTVSFNGVPEGKITGHSYTSTTGFTYAGGGRIPMWAGVPGKDSVPIWAMPGEFIVNRRDTARNLGSLQAMNEGKKFASGGMVGFNAATRGDMNDATLLDVAAETKKISSSYAKAFNKAAASAAAVGGSIPVGSHLAIINAALSAAHVPPPGMLGQWQAGMNTLISRESGWNPNAVNLTDINAQLGHPSQGLAQTIPGTWNHYVPASLRSRGILDPVGNTAAAIRYIVARYGNITRVQQANANKPPLGYDGGGWLKPGTHTVHNGTRRPEAVLTGAQLDKMGGTTVIVNFNGPVGSQKELENWLSGALTSLGRQRRLRNLPVGRG